MHVLGSSRAAAALPTYWLSFMAAGFVVVPLPLISGCNSINTLYLTHLRPPTPPHHLRTVYAMLLFYSHPLTFLPPGLSLHPLSPPHLQSQANGQDSTTDTLKGPNEAQGAGATSKKIYEENLLGVTEQNTLCPPSKSPPPGPHRCCCSTAVVLVAVRPGPPPPLVPPAPGWVCPVLHQSPP